MILFIIDIIPCLFLSMSLGNMLGRLVIHTSFNEEIIFCEIKNSNSIPGQKYPSNCNAKICPAFLPVALIRLTAINALS